MTKTTLSKIAGLEEELAQHSIHVEKEREITELIANPYSKSLPEIKGIANTLTTSRNRNLITADQQKILQDTIVAFFGLSVGSHAALTWAMESRSDYIKISDPDTISPTNLNRLRFGWDTIGKRKTDVVEHELLRINPYMKVISSIKTDKPSVDEFFYSIKPVDLIVDAIDDLEGKLYLRQIARKNKLPLIMATDVGDNVIIDIERYDLEPDLDFFLGRLGDVEKINLKDISRIERLKLVFSLVGFDENSVEMLQSILDIGSKIPTWPQLGATATIAGGTITTLIKNIALKKNIKSGRYNISLDTIFRTDQDPESSGKIKTAMIVDIKKRFNL